MLSGERGARGRPHLPAPQHTTPAQVLKERYSGWEKPVTAGRPFCVLALPAARRGLRAAAGTAAGQRAGACLPVVLPGGLGTV